MTATSLRLRLHWLHSQGHFLTTWSSSGLTVSPLSGHPIQLRFKTMQIIINQGKNAHLTCSSCSHSLLYLVQFLFWWKNMEEPMQQGKHEVTGPPLGPITWGYFWKLQGLPSSKELHQLLSLTYFFPTNITNSSRKPSNLWRFRTVLKRLFQLRPVVNLRSFRPYTYTLYQLQVSQNPVYGMISR